MRIPNLKRNITKKYEKIFSVLPYTETVEIRICGLVFSVAIAVDTRAKKQYLPK